jgi:hypothetical protein
MAVRIDPHSAGTVTPGAASTLKKRYRQLAAITGFSELAGPLTTPATSLGNIANNNSAAICRFTYFR